MGKNKEINQGIAMAMGLAMLLGITGCAGKEEPDRPRQDVLAEDGVQEDVSGEDEAQAAENEADDSKAKEEDSAEEAQKQTKTETGAEEADSREDNGQTSKITEGAEHLGGKIQKLQEDGMTFAHTSLVDEDMSVTLLDVEDAEKISVKYTAETKVEHWIIQGGGAGIDMQEAAFSDLKEGMGVELEGYYDGEIFVATKVIMEDYE